MTSKTPETLEEMKESTREEVLEKLKLAKSVQKERADLGLLERIAILREIYEDFEKHSDKIAKCISLDMGKPITQSESEVTSTLHHIKWDLDNAEKCLSPETTFENDTEIHKVFYEPRGIVAVISPFNYPFSLCCAITMQNLIVGNVVLNKPSPSAMSLYRLLEQIFNNSRLPRGVQQFIHGEKEIWSFLVQQDIDMICFTGSTQTGAYLYQVAATKMIPILMELGGSAPGIIFEDADIDSIIKGVFNKKFSNTGQLCHALKRLIVHENKIDEVVEKLKNLAENQVIGDPMERETTMGPLVNEKQLTTLFEQFNDAVDKGATVICGGKQDIYMKGNYFKPTILTNIDKEMKVWKEEVFWPLLPVVSFKTIDEAIELANDTVYGLGGYVFTTNKETFEKVSKNLKTGMVALNNLAYSAPYNPFGGTKASGIGRTRGKWWFQQLCNIKIITFEKK